MASLADMIAHKVIAVGNKIEFTFKGNYFSAIIQRGGLINNCKMKRPHDQEAESILNQTIAFSSLTAWTEACLQDMMDEYYTRYSSWKRVVHHETKRSMGDLRDQCKLLDGNKKSCEDSNELLKQIFRLQATVNEMNNYILTHCPDAPKQWSYLEVPNLETKEAPSTIPMDVDQTIHTNTQNIILDNTLNQYF